MSQKTAIKVAILWHMHQPNYCEPNSDRLAMPWVRLHALKDYLDMPLNAAGYENVKVTFNLVPALLDQIELYLRGGTDRHLELSRMKAEDLNNELKLEILDSFFSANPTHMIEPYNRYRELYVKYSRDINHKKTLPSLFSSSEIRDLQVWSNLVWVDPLFRQEEPVRSLLAQKKNYTEQDKNSLLDWQLKFLARIIPTYRDLYEQGRIDISFTPYYHPILPLLCDTDCAREALPSIKLPRKRFVHPEDAERQIIMSKDKFTELFGRPMAGMWPSEGSVSQEVLEMMLRHGLTWTATDEEILYHSLMKSNLKREENPLHTVYEYGPGLKLFFRDHNLSDRIGFVYSGWTPVKAVEDFVDYLKDLGKIFKDRLDNVVVPVILDGENAWEYFLNDGSDFLHLFYRTLNDDPEIELVTMTEAAQRVKSRPLTSILAGSWINHNFRIWIGHHEDNTAWDLLSKTRETLVKFQNEHPDFDGGKISAAWKQVYIAEGSDWCWWYGDEHQGMHNDQFDKIFRGHLSAVYDLLGTDKPPELNVPIHGEASASFTILPYDMITAQIDGRVTHFYEWAGAGYFDCLKAGGAMHRVERYISGIHFAFDHNRFYIRLDFCNKKNIELIKDLKFVLAFFTANPLVLELKAGDDYFAGEISGQYQFFLDDILELAIERNYLWLNGYGFLSFNLTLLDGDKKLESWPEDEPIQLDVPEKNKEIFWPS
ncbi:MAG: glycoside hydrolase [candidate division Zixibacteria bacterium]|nr:glycoside hydrolase [candidate division Zixibacteria bacterium]